MPENFNFLPGDTQSPGTQLLGEVARSKLESAGVDLRPPPSPEDIAASTPSYADSPPSAADIAASTPVTDFRDNPPSAEDVKASSKVFSAEDVARTPVMDLVKDKEFSPVAFAIQNPDALSNPKVMDNLREVYRQHKIQGVTGADVLEGVKQIPHAIGSLAKAALARAENFFSMTAGPGPRTAASKQAQGEAAAGMESAAFGLGTMARGAAQKSIHANPIGRLTGGNAQALWENLPPGEIDKEFFGDVAISNQAAAISTGHGELSKASTEELEKQGIHLDPVKVEALSFTDPLAFAAFGEGFRIINAATGAVLGTAATLPLAQAAARAIRPGAEALKKGGKVISQGTRDISEGAIKQLLGQSARAGGAITSAVGKAVGHAGPTAAVVELAQGEIGKAAMALGGSIAGPILKKGGEALSATGRNILAGGSELPRRIVDLGSAGATALGDIGKGAAIGAGIAGVTSESPEETQGLVSYGGAFAAAPGAKGALSKVVSGEMVTPRGEFAPRASAAYGENPALDKVTADTLKAMPEEKANAINFARELGRKFGARIYAYSTPEQGAQIIADAYAKSGSPMAPDAAEHAARQNGFTVDLNGPDGKPQPVIFLNGGATAVGEEMGHVLERILPPEFNQKMDAATRAQFSDEQWNAVGEDYTKHLLGRDLNPGENWRDALTTVTGTKSPDQYMMRENRAANFDTLFKNRGAEIGTPEDLYRRIVGALGRGAEAAGVPLVEGKDAYGRPLSLQSMRASEKALQGVQPKTPEVAPAKTGKDPLSKATEWLNTKSTAEPEQTQAARDILSATQAGRGIRVLYWGAKGDPAGQVTSVRPERRAEIEKARGDANKDRTLTEKEFFPYKVDSTSKGPQFVGWSPDNLDANIQKYAEWHAQMIREGKTTPTIPYDVDAQSGRFTATGRAQLMADVQKFVNNQMAGFTGSGKPIVVPRETAERGFYTPEQKGTPAPLDQNRADLINYLFHVQIPETTTRVAPLHIAGQEVSAATEAGRLVEPVRPRGQYTSEQLAKAEIPGPRGVLEVNPFRQAVEQAAKTSGIARPSLIDVSQRLNFPRIEKAVPSLRTEPFGANTLTLSAGFQPEGEARRDLLVGDLLDTVGGVGTRAATSESRRNVVGNGPYGTIEEPPQSLTPEEAEGSSIEPRVRGISKAVASKFNKPVPEGLGFQPSAHPDAIQSAAIVDDEGKIWTGVSHGEAIDKMRQTGKDYMDAVEDGFMDNSGRFLSRAAAYRRAIDIGQIDKTQYTERAGTRMPLLESSTLAETRQFQPDPLGFTSDKGKEVGLKEGLTLFSSRAPARQRRDGSVGKAGIGLGLRDRNGDTIAGISAYLDPGTDSYEIGAIHVDKGYQNRGIGEALYRELANRIKEEANALTGHIVNPIAAQLRNKVFGEPIEARTIGPGDVRTTSKLNPDVQYQPKPDAIAALKPEEFMEWARGLKGQGFTQVAYDVGKSIESPEQAATLRDHYDAMRADSSKLLKEGNVQDAMTRAAQAQFFREAWEAATGTGSAGEFLRGEQQFQPARNEDVNKVAEDYLGHAIAPAEHKTLGGNNAKRLADYYEAAKHDPKNAEVQKSYSALAKETEAQYRAIAGAGYTIEPFAGEGEPYKSSSEMFSDLENNKHLFFLPSDKASDASTDNLMMRPSGVSFDGGRTQAPVNDIFRAVHDFFGHAKEKYSFGPQGEYNAWREHSGMYSEEAQGALAAETLAQNAWVNFGPHLRSAEGTIPAKGETGYVSPPERPFAPQKNIVIPEEARQFQPRKRKVEEPTELRLPRGVSEFWIAPNGMLHPAEEGHYSKAGDLLPKTIIDKLEKSSDPMADMYDEMHSRGYVRGIHGAEGNVDTLFTNGPSLTHQQRATLEKMAMGHDANVVHNDRDTDIKPTPPEAQYQPAREKDSEPRTFVIRHGETDYNKESGNPDKIRGHLDIPLNAAGQEDALKTAAALRNSGISKIFASDLGRTMDTALALQRTTGAPIEPTEALRPWKFGPTIEGKPTAEVMPKIERLVEHPDEAPEGGESFNQFKDRFLSEYHRIQDAHPKDNTAIVTHYRGTKLLDAWRATGVDNDTVDAQVLAEDGGRKPGSFDVLDKQGNKVPEVKPKEAQFQPARKKDENKFLGGGPEGFSKAWILPNGKVEQLGGMYHAHWLSDDPAGIAAAKKYGIEVPPFEGTDTEGVREDALKKGFARVNMDTHTGLLTIEARGRDWNKLKESVRQLAESNISGIDSMKTILYNTQVTDIVDRLNTKLFDFSDKEKLNHLPFISENSPEPRITGKESSVPVTAEPSEAMFGGYAGKPKYAAYDKAGKYIGKYDKFGEAEDVARAGGGSVKILRGQGGQFQPRLEHPEFEDRLREVMSGQAGGHTFNPDGSVWTQPEGKPADIVTLASVNVPAKELNRENILKALGPYSDLLDEPGIKAGVFSFSKGGKPTVSIDLNAVVPQKFRENSKAFAKANDQVAIWDADKSEEVATGGKGNTKLQSLGEITDALQNLMRGKPVDVPEILRQNREGDAGAEMELPGFGKRTLSTKELSGMTKKAIADYYPESVIPARRDESIPSAITESPLYKKAGSEDNAVQAFARKLVEFAKEYQDDPRYKSGQRWYSEFTPMLKKTFGADAPIFAELLASTSPQNAPESNFAYAVDALEGFKSGRFKKIVAKFNEGMDKLNSGAWEKSASEGQTPAAWLENWVELNDLWPRQSNGQKYGISSGGVLQVLARRWLTEARGPKTLNFVKNLLGTGHEATIDLWADRTMRRLGYSGLVDRWRILPKNATGVSEADFSFSQKAFRAAAKQLGMRADSLQGALWFAEKSLWANEGWSRLNLGDYRAEIGKTEALRAGVRERMLRQKASAKPAKAEQQDLLVEPRYENK